MKVLHCCLAAFYIDDYGYQENILPKMHKLQGHDVRIIASTETYIDNNQLGYVEPRSYLNEDSIPVTRIPYAQWLPHNIVKKLRIYEGFLSLIEDFEPDVIFLHDVQFISILDVIKYAENNPKVKIYVDGHTDYINSARNWISKNILHKLIYKWCAQKIEPYASKFWGVTPLRVDFFVDVYGINKNKVDLLVMGVDDSVVDMSKKELIRTSVRQELHISQDDFVIVTGGKIDKRKNIHILMKAIQDLNLINVKLLIFGTPTSEMKDEFEELSKAPNIISIGWISPKQVYDYLFASDLAFFPGTHSVLWEQAVGVGLPCVFKKWEGMQHVDVGGNCIFIDKGHIEEIKDTLKKLIKNKELLNDMKRIALEKGIAEFSYSQIAKKAIGET